MTTIAILGIDLGKNVCSLTGLDETGKVVLRRRMKREGGADTRREAFSLCRGDGSLLRRPSSWPDFCRPRT